jgi:hypothetical protein
MTSTAPEDAIALAYQSVTPEEAAFLPQDIRRAMGSQAATLLALFSQGDGSKPADKEIRSSLNAIFKQVNKDPLKNQVSAWANHCKEHMGEAYQAIRKIHLAELMPPPPRPKPATVVSAAEEAEEEPDEPKTPPPAPLPQAPPPVARKPSLVTAATPESVQQQQPSLPESPIELFLRQGSLLKRTVSRFNVLLRDGDDESGGAGDDNVEITTPPAKKAKSSAPATPSAAKDVAMPPSPLELFQATGSLRPPRQPHTNGHTHAAAATSLSSPSYGRSTRLFLYTQGLDDVADDDEKSHKLGRRARPGAGIRAASLDVEDDVFVAPVV